MMRFPSPSPDLRTFVAKPTLAVIGMGYVGAVSAAALAERGWPVIGVEADPAKRAWLAAGRCPIHEPGLEALLAAGLRAGRLRITGDLAAAAEEASVIMVAVGTPGRPDGGVDLGAIDAVTDGLAAALAPLGHAHVVIIRSTVPPGTTRNRIAPRIKRASPGAVVCHHPEFLREGAALRDWQQPALIAWGADGADQAPVAALFDRLYAGVVAPRLALGTAESELMKYACNAFHALKVSFANEIATVAAHCGADAAAVMDGLCQDHRLNISPAYLRPGLPFGGSCLPKDTRALAAAGRAAGTELPLLEGVLASNQRQLERLAARVRRATGGRPTAMLGLTFKAGSGDLRESPYVDLARRLVAAGTPLKLYDPDLAPAKEPFTPVLAGERDAKPGGLPALPGGLDAFPELRDRWCASLEAALDGVEVVVLGKAVPGLEQSALAGRKVVDLSGAVGRKLLRPAAAPEESAATETPTKRAAA